MRRFGPFLGPKRLQRSLDENRRLIHVAVTLSIAALMLIAVCGRSAEAEPAWSGASPEALTPQQACERYGAYGDAWIEGETVVVPCVVAGAIVDRVVLAIPPEPEPEPIVSPVIPWTFGWRSMYATVAAHWPEQADYAWGIVLCESDLNGDGQPDADVIAQRRLGGAGERGAWQVLAEYHGAVPYDFEGQTAQARRIYDEKGWTPWSCRFTRYWR